VSDTPFLPTDTPGTLQFRPGTFFSHQTTAPNPSTTIAAATQGRYVRVQLTFADYLSVAEVQVFGPQRQGPTDLALGKPATQSSTFPGYSTAVAASAVDGSTDGNFGDGSVTATNLDANPWWQVDLGAPANVNSVVIWNRTDCCASRLNDYWVFVSNTPFLPTDTPATLQLRAGTFFSHQTSAPNPSTTIQVGTQGRYVRVQLTGANYLSLAEVQVFGTAGNPSGSNLAQGKAVTQSSTLPGYPTAVASSAVDGNTDGNFGDGSVTATNLDNNAWRQLDLGASANVSSVVVWNRTDCCASRLKDYRVFVSNTPFSPTDTPAMLQYRAGTFFNHHTSTPNPSAMIEAGIQGHYVRV
ncbi:MAG TPA: discoidin domain-containing protein, partial [Bryobacteraceae bacterium]|nr:discoidin domain-containing protein [Bryobacteraceae bacterium]